MFQIQETEGTNRIDETDEFQNARYVGSSEAVGRILEHRISDHFPLVVKLAVHLENGQCVFFNEENAIDVAIQNPPPTTLTAFFDLCCHNDFAKTLKYHEVPEYYTWQNGVKRWQRRKRGKAVENQEGVWKCQAIGRIYNISPRQRECYYLRLLLNDVVGPTSFQTLRTVNGQELSFREACLARGLLEND